jgi:low temperature requirement protein LtrA
MQTATITTAPSRASGAADNHAARLPERLRRVASAPVRLSPPPLRTADGHHREERRASWLDLFFDLVFAGAVGQLAGALQEHPGLGTLARFVMLFVPVWWLWVQFAYYADRHESEDSMHRVLFLVAMLICVGLAASAPRALAGHTTPFVIAFVCLRALQLVLYVRARASLPASRRLYSWYLIFFGSGGALWLLSLTASGPARFGWWAAALAADAAGALAILHPSRRLPVNPSHLADRFQLFVLIVLGESVARLIGAAALRPWSLPLAIVLAAALLTLASLWWAWLSVVSPEPLRTPAGMVRFTAVNLPIVTGVAAASAGLHIAILAAHGGGTIGVWPRVALYGGVSLFLLATAVLPSGRLSRPARLVRVATSAAALGLVFMGAIVAPVYLVPALIVIVALGLASEGRLTPTARKGGAPARRTWRRAAPLARTQTVR